MTAPSPAVTVVVPTFNRAKRVAVAVESVLSQTFRDFELIVVDDGSTDDTLEVLKRFGAAVRVIHQANAGVSAARNVGIREAAAPLVAFLDSDDRWLPTKLERQVPLMNEPDVVLSATDWANEPAPEQGEFARVGIGPDETLVDAMPFLTRHAGRGVWLPTWIVRKAAARRVGGFDERLRVAEDTRLLFRLAQEGRFAILPEILTLRRVDHDSTQLTRVGEARYHEQLADASVELLVESYYRLKDQPDWVGRRLRSMLAYFLRCQTEFAAMRDDHRLARRRAMETLLFRPRRRDAVVALLGLLSPRTLGRRTRRKFGVGAGKRPGDTAPPAAVSLAGEAPAGAPDRMRSQH